MTRAFPGDLEEQTKTSLQELGRVGPVVERGRGNSQVVTEQRSCVAIATGRRLGREAPLPLEELERGRKKLRCSKGPKDREKSGPGEAE